MGFRITSWNVNGIRNPFGYQPWREQRTFKAMFDILGSDIVIMQETKIQRKDLQDDMVLVPGWDVYFSLPRHKKGYSGVAIYTKNATCAPIRAEEGILGILTGPKSTTRYRDLPKDQQIGGYPLPHQLSADVDEILLDSEGRCVLLEFPAFVLIGVYSPANRDETRSHFRAAFVEALDTRIRNLVAEGKEVILTGDLNVIRSEIDTCNVTEMLRKEEMTMEEWMSMSTRRLFNQLVFDGTVYGPRDEGREKPVLWDLCRVFHPDRNSMFTCWDTKRNTRPANLGSRIDYVLCSNGLKDWFIDSNIQEGLMGSDHCPVYSTMADTIKQDGADIPLEQLMNPPSMFKDGKRVREWESRDTLPMSAKLIPEFDRRQSIRDMFTRKSSQVPLQMQTSTSQAGQTQESQTSMQEVATDEDVGDTTGGNDSSSAEASGYFGSMHDTASLGPENLETASAAKRSLGSTEASAQQPPPKKVKGSVTGTAAGGQKSKAAAGQRTLQGFFKPKNAAASARTDERTESDAQARIQAQTQSPAAGDRQTPPPGSTVSNGAVFQDKTPPTKSSAAQITTTPTKTPKAVSSSPDRVFDPIENKESWSKLLGKRVVPKCEHNEPCISLLTKKPGVNCGRSFYICPRPLGPSGEKEKGTEWRCGTFIWSSDWSKPQS